MHEHVTGACTDAHMYQQTCMCTNSAAACVHIYAVTVVTVIIHYFLLTFPQFLIEYHYGYITFKGIICPPDR